MHVQYLSYGELAELLKVPTTAWEAECIRSRNLALLGDLQGGEHGVTRHRGCPHCQYAAFGDPHRNRKTTHGHMCHTCAWNAMRGEYDRSTHDFHCCHVPFAGCVMNDVHDVVLYGPATEEIDCSGPHTPDEYKDAFWFLSAHVDWADVIIELGGTVDEPWRELTDEERKAWEPHDMEWVAQELKLTFDDYEGKPEEE